MPTDDATMYSPPVLRDGRLFRMVVSKCTSKEEWVRTNLYIIHDGRQLLFYSHIKFFAHSNTHCRPIDRIFEALRRVDAMAEWIACRMTPPSSFNRLSSLSIEMGTSRVPSMVVSDVLLFCGGE